MDPSIQVVSEFQRRAVIAIVIVMEEWSSGDESLESSLVSEFFNILLSLWHSFITSTLVRSDFLPNQIFYCISDDSLPIVAHFVELYIRL